MKILFLYYTGTYNTRFLTDLLIDGWAKNEFDSITRVEIDSKAPIIETKGYDLVALGYPIYGFNSPRPFNKYLRKLSFEKGQPYIIYKNSGETFAMNDTSNRVIKRIMRHKKATFKGEYHFVMPYNIHFRFADDFIRQILHYDKKLIDILAHDLKVGTIRTKKTNLIYQIASFFVSIQKIGGNVNSFFYSVDPPKCLKCNLCVEKCPHENIYWKKGKIKFHHHCDMCMRCSFYCPANAIKIGFLEGWKVNGKYPLEKLSSDAGEVPAYINKESRGFYKCFIDTFRWIDEEYEKISDVGNALSGDAGE